MEGRWREVATGEGEKRGGGSKSEDRGRSRHKDETQSSGAHRGLGSLCRHNERSQTYPASLISTIKATLSARHAACFFSRLQRALSRHPRSNQERRSARLVEPSAGIDTFFCSLDEHWKKEKKGVCETTVSLSATQPASGFRCLRLFPDTWCGTVTALCEPLSVNVRMATRRTRRAIRLERNTTVLHEGNSQYANYSL